MAQDATSQPANDTAASESPATEDPQAQQPATAPDADTGGDSKPPEQGGDEDKLGDSGRRALASERKARRDAEKSAADLRARLQQFEDANKSELQKAQDDAKRYQEELTTTRVANARLMAAAAHNLPPDLIDLLGTGTDEEIEARAKLLASKLPAKPAEAASPKAPASTRPLESLTPGAKPATQQPEDPNAWLRRMAGRTP